MASVKEGLRVLYISSAIISIIGVVIASAIINVKSALDAWWKLTSILSGGMLGLFLLTIFSKQRNVMGAIAGVIAGLPVIIWLSLSNIFLGTGSKKTEFSATGLKVVPELRLLLNEVKTLLGSRQLKSVIDRCSAGRSGRSTSIC